MYKIFILSFISFLFVVCNYGLAQIEEKENIPKTLHLLFAGDVMMHGPQIDAAEIIENKKYDFKPSFQYVKPIIEKADLAIANLELSLLGQPPYNGFPTFRSPIEVADALKDTGFDVLVTANNHANDLRKKGLISTIDNVEKIGFYQTGSFRNQAERDLHYPLVIYKNGFKIALLNYTEITNNKNIETPSILNMMDEQVIQEDMATARNLNPDIIIVLLHWGEEYELYPTEEQEELAKQIIKWGAHLIVGAHPHVVQPIKQYRVKMDNGKLREGLVCFSLGNFISSQKKENTDGGILFEAIFEKNEVSDITKFRKHRAIPVWRYMERKDGRVHQFYTLPIEDFEKENSFLTEDAKEDMLECAEVIKGVLED